MDTTKAGGRRNNLDDFRGDRLERREGEFLATVNDAKLHFADPVPNGRQILSEAGFLPAGDHVLIQCLLHGTRSVGLDELVDLREKGTEAFWAFRTDRVFRFTINDRGYEWGAAGITEPELRRIASVGDHEVLMLECDGENRILVADDIIELGNSGTEHLRTVKRLVTVCLDTDVEIEILCGAYTTEELIHVLGVQDGYLLNVLDAQGRLVPLKPNQTITIQADMKCFSQVPQGGSS